MEDLPDSMSPPPSTIRVMPVREDCWSQDATFTLIEAWGQRFLDLNRGNLRQKHWQEVADLVNHRHAHLNNKAYRTDVQCKNRIDTLKKKYKTEKSRVLDSHGSFQSHWPFFAPLDSLIGPSSSSATNNPSPMFSSPPPVVMASVAPQQQPLGGPPMAVPLLPYRRSLTPVPSVLPQKRPGPVATPVPLGYSNIRKNYSAVAAAAAAAETDEDEDDEEEEEQGRELDNFKRNGQVHESDGLRNLARAIEMFGEVYARVESEKQKQIVELEKQRMQFAKELECQRMQMLVEMQVQLEKVKRAKRSNSNSNGMVRLGLLSANINLIFHALSCDEYERKF